MAGGFLRGGMRPGKSRGSMSKIGDDSPMPSRPNPMAADSEHGSGDGKETKIIHHPNGEHEVHHADGEVTKHPSAGHMAAMMHAKHGNGGDVGNMESDGMGGPVTTHHVGPDGEVSGPNEHATPDEGAAHLAQMCGGGMDSEEGSEPDGYGAGFAG